MNSSLFHEDFHFKWTNQSVDKVLASQAQGPVFPYLDTHKYLGSMICIYLLPDIWSQTGPDATRKVSIY